jgi:hypothetical protein
VNKNSLKELDIWPLWLSVEKVVVRKRSQRITKYLNAQGFAKGFSIQVVLE